MPCNQAIYLKTIPPGGPPPQEKDVTVNIPLCHHIKTNGIQCQSPALKRSSYCFFHDRLHERHRNFRISGTSARSLRREYDIQLHNLDDTESIHFALSQVITGLASGNLSCERASALLYGLQLVASNLRNLSLQA